MLSAHGVQPLHAAAPVVSQPHPCRHSRLTLCPPARLPCPALSHCRRYGCSGPEVRREYHVAGGRPQIDLAQQHFRVVAELPGGGEREAVVGASSLVRAACCCCCGEMGGRH